MAAGYVTVGGATICATEWRVNGTLDTTDADKIDVTTFCSTEKEYIEAAAGFSEGTITCEIDSLTCDSLVINTEYTVVVGRVIDTVQTPDYTLTQMVYKGITAENPVDDRFEVTHTFEKTISI